MKLRVAKKVRKNALALNYKQGTLSQAERVLTRWESNKGKTKKVILKKKKADNVYQADSPKKAESPKKVESPKKAVAKKVRNIAKKVQADTKKTSRKKK